MCVILCIWITIVEKWRALLKNFSVDVFVDWTCKLFVWCPLYSLRNSDFEIEADESEVSENSFDAKTKYD